MQMSDFNFDMPLQDTSAFCCECNRYVSICGVFFWPRIIKGEIEFIAKRVCLKCKSLVELSFKHDGCCVCSKRNVYTDQMSRCLCERESDIRPDCLSCLSELKTLGFLCKDCRIIVSKHHVYS